MRKIFFTLFLFFSIHAVAQCEAEQKIFTSSNGNFTYADCSFLSNGAMVSCGYMSPGKGIITKYNVGNTSVEWAKSYNSFYVKLIKTDIHDDIITVGVDPRHPITSISIIKTDNTGNIKWVKKLQDSFSPDTWTLESLITDDLLTTSDGGIVICGAKQYKQPSQNSYKYKSFILKMDAVGNIVWTREDTNNGHDESFSLAEKNGALYVGGTTSIGPQYATLSKINLTNGSLISVKGYLLQNILAAYFRDIHATADGFIIGAEAYDRNTAKTGYYIVKLADDGSVIQQKQIHFSGTALFNPYYEISPTADGGCLVWLHDEGNYLNVTTNPLYKLNGQLAPEWKKAYPVPGANPNATIRKVWEENNIYKGIGFSTDPSINSTNNFARLFTMNGDGSLRGCITNDAVLNIKDSLQFSVQNIAWSNTYNMVFTAPFTENYTVENVSVNEKIICGNTCTMQDFTITGDTILCNEYNGTELTIRPSGTCSNNFNWEVDPQRGVINPVDDHTVKYFPKLTGYTALTVVWKGVCKSIEKKINIYYNKYEVKKFGKDTVLCKNDTLQLLVNTPYPNILWSDNSTGINFKTTQQGLHWVSISPDNICFNKDTFNVQFYPATVLNIHDQSRICFPDPLILQPNQDYKNYTWQDGSLLSTYTVKQPGKYWVTVTDNNQCIASDTVEVMKMINKPENFVSFSDSSICYQQEILLTLNKNFTRYNWNGGAASSATYKINQPGLYNIEVTDNEGCKGTDSVMVEQKQCAADVYFPSAFSPQGVNKIFRPLFIGDAPEKSHLLIYNRWGEKVFETFDANMGWNGEHKNTGQDSNVFAWVCIYKFFGQSEKMEKGTVTLVR